MKYHIWFRDTKGEMHYVSAFSANAETYAYSETDNIDEALEMEFNHAFRIKSFLEYGFGKYRNTILHVGHR